MKYIFVHIGKTAGTSFRSFLQTNIPKAYFGYSKLWYLTDVRDTQKFLESEPNGMEVFKHFNLFSEHFQYGLHPYLGTKDYQYITMFREPISRTISAYKYANDRGWINDKVNIIDWFHDNGSQKYYQLHHVCGLPEDTPYELKLDIALKNIKDDKFLFGFTNKYDEFIDLCCDINKWKPQYRITNTTKTKKNISNEDKEKLKELLEVEIAFYDKAVEIYNEKYKSFIK